MRNYNFDCSRAALFEAAVNLTDLTFHRCVQVDAVINSVELTWGAGLMPRQDRTDVRRLMRFYFYFKVCEIDLLLTPRLVSIVRNLTYLLGLAGFGYFWLLTYYSHQDPRKHRSAHFDAESCMEVRYADATPAVTSIKAVS